MGARVVPQGVQHCCGCPARLRLWKDEEEDAAPERYPGRGLVRVQRVEIGGSRRNGWKSENHEAEERNGWKSENQEAEYLRGSSSPISGKRTAVPIFIHLVGPTKIVVLIVLGQLAANIVPYCFRNPSV